MAYDLQEQEHIDALKAWWKKYGTVVSVLLVLGVGAYGAVQFQKYRQQQAATDAAVIYAQLQDAANKKDSKQLNAHFKTLSENYPKTSYATLGGFVSAKAFYEINDVAAAEKSLSWVAQHSKDLALQIEAKLRLASVLLDAKKYPEALKQLEIAEIPSAYVTDVAERRGDVFFVQNKIAEARAEYTKAQAALTPQSDPNRRLILDNKLIAIGLPQ